MNLIKRRLLVTNWLLLLALTGTRTLPAQSASVHPLWEVKGATNSVYLLGSIHFAKDDFYPLPKPIEQAYNRASIIVFEADLGKMKSLETQTKLLKAGMCPFGDTLSQHVSKETYEALQAWLNKTAGKPAVLDQMKPWLASVTVVALQLQKLGFKPDQGVDEHFYSRAKADEKEIRGLETVDSQIGLFADLTREEDELFLKSMLEDADRFPTIFADVIEAWKTGDSKKIEPLLLEVMEKYPFIYRKFLTDRNRAWLPQIEELLRSGKTAFVVVGMGHLVGKDGLVQLLKDKGLKVEQL